MAPADARMAARQRALLAGVAAGVVLLLLVRRHASADTLAPHDAPAAGAAGAGAPSGGVVMHLKYFLAGSICACLSHVGGVPIDVLKTRLQTDPGRYDGMWDAAWKVTRTEGPGMLLQGLAPTAAGYAIQGGLKYGLYELFKSGLTARFAATAAFAAAAAAAAGAPPLPLAPLLAAAAAAELIASSALCPYEAARIRLVADPAFASGLGGALSRLVRENGVAGVFGSLPAIYLKQVPYTMAQLVTYDGVTRTLAARLAARGEADGASSSSFPSSEWATVVVALAGASAAAVVASLASQPGDTLLSKLNQGRRAAHAGLAHARARRSKPGAAGAAPPGAAGAGGAAAGVPPVVTSSDDEVELGALGSPPRSDADVALSAGMDADPSGPAPTFRAAGGAGCGPMCALAVRLGPAGLMLGWHARLAHTGTIVLVQLLIYDAVKAAVGLPVSAHGGGHGVAAAAAAQETARRLAAL